jgi:hypothetical protein
MRLGKVWLTAALLSGLCGGCIIVGTGDKTQPPTLGKQLSDLKTARDNGAISDQEYQTTRTKLLNQCK